MNRVCVATAVALLFAISGCASNDGQKSQLDRSYLQGTGGKDALSDKAAENQQVSVSTSGFSRLPAMSRGKVQFTDTSLSRVFSENKTFQVAARDMMVEDFLHYVFGELLNINYVLSPEVKGNQSPVTLSLADSITEKRLFEITQSVLEERSLTLSKNNGVYLVAVKKADSAPSAKVGIGRTVDTVPTGAQQIMQIVPILYGIKMALKTTVEQLINVSVTLDARQSSLFVEGNAQNVRRALELIQLLDSPANRGRYIGLVELAFIDAGLYLEQMSTLLENEGIPNSINTPVNNNLVFVPLHQIGAVAVFAATAELLERVKFWTTTIDKPSEGDVKRYYVYYPKYARAKDIGDSLMPLLNAASSQVKSTAAKANKNDASGKQTGQATQTSRVRGASNNDMTLVVDERSNSMIFYSTGTAYKNIIPLIRKLDVLPKQILIEMVIAEVNLTDDFKFGVEWALAKGDVSLGTLGAFSVNAATGAVGGLSIISKGATNDQISASFFAENQNVNILSRPSLLVRDGVSASINIGADIAVTGSTVNNLNSGSANTVTTTAEYRKTGINISVTPTVNAQGIVIMGITQSLSNVVPNSSGASGNPSIFERSLDTEVVAESGKTIILAGLMDERKTLSESKVPLLSDLPLVGNLFKREGDNKTKQELVLMITPRVISGTEEWSEIISGFENKLSGIEINN